MRLFVESLPGKGRVLDVGSMDINGTYRDLFPAGWSYTGIDVVPGKNVDKVVDPYRWTKSIKASSFDVVISGQALEHIEDDAAVAGQIYRALKPGGLCCIIVPSAGPKHGYPDDYRRYTEESLAALLKGAGFKVVRTSTDAAPIWFDVVAVAMKPRGRAKK